MYELYVGQTLLSVGRGKKKEAIDIDAAMSVLIALHAMQAKIIYHYIIRTVHPFAHSKVQSNPRV